ncbi:MAG: hypothetical protein MJ128_03115 [Mogibacterium sp.]|nr:hypothetical protein [Mogibacterium sp.]
MDKFKNNEDFDYTIVMDPRYPGLDPIRHEPLAEAEKKPEPEAPAKEPEKPVIDLWERLYAEYEEMCFRDPTILDKDDAYPHSYQWRVGDRYDPAKIEVLKAALSEGKRITDTEEYQNFIENIKSRKIEPLSWE